MEKVLGELLAAAGDPQKAACLGLERELDLGCVWVDATCLKACLHFPTDWVLLRDAVRTIMKSILTIRRHGLRHRMQAPEQFLGAVNALSMKMAAAGRRGRPGGRKERKAVLRLLKKLTRVVEGHGRRYRQLLDEHWQESDLPTRAAAEVILRRLDNVLGQLPEARRQAQERIIGGRKVANKEKILSLYEHDVHVIVRGKAGAEVEFGNGLLLAENSAGFIVDHELCQEMAPDDGRWLRQRLIGRLLGRQQFLLGPGGLGESGHHPEIVGEHRPRHLQLPTLEALGPGNPVEKDILDYGDARLVASAPAQQTHEAGIFGTASGQFLRVARADRVDHFLLRQARRSGRAVEAPVGTHGQRPRSALGFDRRAGTRVCGMLATMMTGSCLCGSVRYSVAAESFGTSLGTLAGNDQCLQATPHRI